MDASGNFKSPRWHWVVAVWLGLGLFDATQTVFVMRSEGMHHYWMRLFFTNVIAWLPWMLATPFIFRLDRRFPGTQWKRPAFWFAHLSASTGIGLVASAWVALWEELLNPFALTPGPDPFVQLCLRKFYSGTLSSIILYGLVLLVAHIAETQRRFALQQAETARLNEQLSKAQLNALRRQIEPHFLFNTLNAIAGLVREERNDAAVGMIAELSDFLRRVVNDSDRQQVPLSEELEFTQKYLDIQKVRFAERLEFSVDVPEELLGAQVPSLLLQPMVENAVKHGIAKRVQGGAIRISAWQANGSLTLRIFNEGPFLFAGWQQNQSGIGIENVRTRLKSLYGNASELTLRNHRGGVEALVSLPYVNRSPSDSELALDVADAVTTSEGAPK
jgi:two-component system LytT family sensor kinase